MLGSLFSFNPPIRLKIFHSCAAARLHGTSLFFPHIRAVQNFLAALLHPGTSVALGKWSVELALRFSIACVNFHSLGLLAAYFAMPTHSAFSCTRKITWKFAPLQRNSLFSHRFSTCPSCLTLVLTFPREIAAGNVCFARLYVQFLTQFGNFRHKITQFGRFSRDSCRDFT